MTVRDATIAKIQQLPETLAEEVGDFVDFLLLKKDSEQWQMLRHLAESHGMAESDFADYLSNLEDYENRLALGEIQW
jgi:hypothetical protein